MRQLLWLRLFYDLSARRLIVCAALRSKKLGISFFIADVLYCTISHIPTIKSQSYKEPPLLLCLGFNLCRHGDLAYFSHFRRPHTSLFATYVASKASKLWWILRRQEFWLWWFQRVVKFAFFDDRGQLLASRGKIKLYKKYGLGRQEEEVLNRFWHFSGVVAGEASWGGGRRWCLGVSQYSRSLLKLNFVLLIFCRVHSVKNYVLCHLIAFIDDDIQQSRAIKSSTKVISVTYVLNYAWANTHPLIYFFIQIYLLDKHDFLKTSASSFKSRRILKWYINPIFDIKGTPIKLKQMDSYGQKDGVQQKRIKASEEVQDELSYRSSKSYPFWPTIGWYSRSRSISPRIIANKLVTLLMNSNSS